MIQRYFLLLVVIFFSISAFAQESTESKSIIKLSPLGLVNKARIGYEHALGGQKSWGTMLTFTSPNWPSGGWLPDRTGLYLEPFMRFYLTEKSLKGLYIQPMVKAGLFFQRNMSYVPPDSSAIDFITHVFNRNYFSAGAGLYIGYQTFIGKHITIDFNIGIQRWTLPKKAFQKNSNSQEQNNNNYEDARISWYETINGHSSFISSYFTIGYKF